MSERSERVTVRLTPSEEEWIIKMAEKAGVSKSRYMRKVTLCEFPQSADPFYEKDRKFNFSNGITHQEMKRVFQVDFPKVGRLLNQIARKLNSGEKLEEEMVEVMKNIRQKHSNMARTIVKALR